MALNFLLALLVTKANKINNVLRVCVCVCVWCVGEIERESRRQRHRETDIQAVRQKYIIRDQSLNHETLIKELKDISK